MKRRVFQAVALPMVAGLMCSVSVLSAAIAQEAPEAKTPATTAPVAPAPAAETAQSQGQGSFTSVTDINKSVVPKTTTKASDIDAISGNSTFDALRDVPGVTNADSKGPGADNIQIRGIHLNSSTSYHVNDGMAITNNLQNPSEDKARVEALKGVGALQFGFAAPGGLVNYVMKRATDAPITDIGTQWNGFGAIVSTIDVGRRFGDQNQLGIRINGAAGTIRPGISGGAGSADGTRWMGSVGADYRADSSLRFWFDYEKYQFDIVEQGILVLPAAFKGGPLNNRIVLPSIPNPRLLRSGPWSQTEAEGTFYVGGFEKKFNEGWKFLAETGTSKSERPDRSLASFTLAQGQVGGSLGIQNPLAAKGVLWTQADFLAGNGSLNIVEAQHGVAVNHYVRSEVTKHSEWNGLVENDLTVGYNYNYRNTDNNANTAVNIAQNLYNPYALKAPIAPHAETYGPQQNYDQGYYFNNVLTYDKWLHILGGVRLVEYDSSNTTNGGNYNLANGVYTSQLKGVAFQTKKVHEEFYTPAVGGIIDVNKHVSLYASYVKALEDEGLGLSNTSNFGESLGAGLALQEEVGVQLKGWNGLSVNLAHFYINRANVVNDPSGAIAGTAITGVTRISGVQIYSGEEFVLNYKLNKEFRFLLTGALTDAYQVAPDPAINGRTVENTPKFAGSATVYYSPNYVKGLTVNFGGDYKSPRAVNPQNQAYIPETYIYRTGFNYTTKIADKPTDFNFNVTNLFDERYWSTANNTALGVGLERQFRFGMKVHF